MTPTVALLPKAGSANSNGDNSIIAAVAGKRIRVTSLTLSTAVTTVTTCIFTNAASGTAIHQSILQAAANTTQAYSVSGTVDSPIMSTSPGNALILNLSAGNIIHYSITYYLE